MSKLKEKELLELLAIAVQNSIEYFVINKDKEFIAKIPKLRQACKQIMELIKIFFAKEISAGPIKKDISRSDLVEWLQGINQAATAMKDYYVMKATTQLIEMMQETNKARLIWDATCPGIDASWLPSAENINALPEPVRNYVAGLETNADPPSMVADNIIMKDTIKTLEKMLEERPAVDEGFVNTWAQEFIKADNTPSMPVTLIKRMLNEAGVEVIKNEPE